MLHPDPQIAARIQQWLQPEYDAETRAAIEKMIADKAYEALTDAFYRDLEFGTGGLRGIMGVGSNRMNRYTLAAATQGLSNYLHQQFPGQSISVALAHDSRNNANTFARIVAEIFTANDITVYFFEALRPTPELSFAIRALGCQSGVMLTASHNPKEYSGYKAYWSDGCQIIAPHDKNIIAEVNAITRLDQIKFVPKPALIKPLGKEMDDQFMAEVLAQSLHPEAIKRQSQLKIVYSPLHGTGLTLVPETLRRMGFEAVHLVEEQCTMDGNFPTVVYPNPEEQEAMTMGLTLADKIGADLVMATDPDADRVGIAIRNDQNELMLLNGNQTGVLLFHYLLSSWEKLGKPMDNAYIIKTVVTSYLIDRIAADKGVACYNTLTGFKYIGALMGELEGQKTFIAACEESYGYLIGDYVRDKDAVAGCAMIAEMAAYYKNQGKTLFEALLDIYTQYGLYQEDLLSVTKTGKKGAEEIAALMDKYRSNPPQHLGGRKVIRLKDYQLQTETDLLSVQTFPIALPKSNVLQFITEGDFIVSARPSGTEPKIKYYVSVNKSLSNKATYWEEREKLLQTIQAMKADLV